MDFKVLWPPEPPYAGTTNDNSIVIMAEYGKFKCLLTADITTDAEKELVQIYGDALKADLLQVSHHGSIDGSSEEFLKAVSPKTAVIVAPKGFASSTVINRLKQHCKDIYLNSDGDVVISAGTDEDYSVRR